MLVIKSLYEDYKQDVFRYLVSLTHDPTLSEDLVSETFLSAIKSIVNFRGESDIKTWLFSIARNKWYEYLRKKKQEVSFDSLVERYLAQENIEIDVEKMVLLGDLVASVLALLEGEKEIARDIVIMRIEGYSYHEISSKYGISESSARVIDFRTKKKIREALEKEGCSYE